MSIRRRKGFGPDQVIDLDKYESRWTEEEKQSHVKRGKFIGFRFLDLSKYGGDYLHEELFNIAISTTTDLRRLHLNSRTIFG